MRRTGKRPVVLWALGYATPDTRHILMREIEGPLPSYGDGPRGTRASPGGLSPWWSGIGAPAPVPSHQPVQVRFDSRRRRSSSCRRAEDVPTVESA